MEGTGRSEKAAQRAIEAVAISVMSGLSWSQFTARRGDRRSSRILIEEPTVREAGDALVLTFALPKGSYATSVLREVMKVDVDEPHDRSAAEDRAEDAAP